jgi:hypothetical protein
LIASFKDSDSMSASEWAVSSSRDWHVRSSPIICCPQTTTQSWLTGRVLHRVSASRAALSPPRSPLVVLDPNNNISTA